MLGFDGAGRGLMASRDAFVAIALTEQGDLWRRLAATT
jgi:hypothetical protein